MILRYVMDILRLVTAAGAIAFAFRLIQARKNLIRASGFHRNMIAALRSMQDAHKLPDADGVSIV